ncbi:hypothetical protein GF351_03255 [Candidatus Woesearchaeota archaeon]|nr:hypothetical protein [Candidatus Woesearchaeota archaeon]
MSVFRAVNQEDLKSIAEALPGAESHIGEPVQAFVRLQGHNYVAGDITRRSGEYKLKLDGQTHKFPDFGTLERFAGQKGMHVAGDPVNGYEVCSNSNGKVFAAVEDTEVIFPMLQEGERIQLTRTDARYDEHREFW